MTESGRKFIITQDIFRGPIDLLLYLIQEKELDISEVSLAKITDQYLKFIEILEEMDIDNIGEFIYLAATLLHIKAQSLFPGEGEEGEEGEDDGFDPTDELITQLLEYKKYKLSGMMLAEKRERQDRIFRRGYRETLDFDRDEAGNPLEEVDLGNLLNVFSELMEQTLRNLPETLIYDDISLEEHIESILDKLDDKNISYITFSEFILGRSGKLPSREFMCGAFIACLELVKQYQIKITQAQQEGEIRIERVSKEEREKFLREEKESVYSNWDDDQGYVQKPGAN